MADEKKETAVAATAKTAAPAVEEKKASVKEKEATKVVSKAADNKEKAEPKKTFALATKHDYEVVLDPRITEKSMALLQKANKVTVRVATSANKTEIKESFQRLYQAQVDDVKVVNVLPKEKSRGGRYKGVVSGFKKAIITLHEGVALDLFKE